jgi:DNA-binding IclR family transcriptional regulator
MPSRTPTHRSGTIQSLRRGLQVLQAIADAGGRASLTDIAHKLGLNFSTTHHLAKTLEEDGYLVQNDDSRKYYLGNRIFAVAAVAWDENEVAHLGEPLVAGIMLKTGHSAHLAVLDVRDAVVIRKVDAEGPWRLAERTGAMRPLANTALGKALVAFKQPDIARRYMARMPFKAYTPNSITSPRAFQAEIARVRARGYAIDDEEYALGMRCVAAPVFNFSGRVVAAMGISGPSFSLTPEHIEVHQVVVREYATRLSRILGYRPDRTESLRDRAADRPRARTAAAAASPRGATRAPREPRNDRRR